MQGGGPTRSRTTRLSSQILRFISRRRLLSNRVFINLYGNLPFLAEDFVIKPG